MTTEAPRDTSDRIVVVVLAVCALMLAGGFLLKGQCLAPEAFPEGHQYSRLCYNDIQPLYGVRAVADNVFPYVDGEYTDDGQLINGAIEYPVLTGIFLWLAGLFADDANGYLRWSAILLAPFGLLAAYLLARMARLASAHVGRIPSAHLLLVPQLGPAGRRRRCRGDVVLVGRTVRFWLRSCSGWGRH